MRGMHRTVFATQVEAVSVYYAIRAAEIKLRRRPSPITDMHVIPPDVWPAAAKALRRPMSCRMWEEPVAWSVHAMLPSGCFESRFSGAELANRHGADIRRIWREMRDADLYWIAQPKVLVVPRSWYLIDPQEWK